MAACLTDVAPGIRAGSDALWGGRLVGAYPVVREEIDPASTPRFGYNPAVRPAESQDITRLLKAWCQGDKAALDGLAPLVYGELRQIAHRYMRKEDAANSLQTTALVNEAYLRLVDAQRVEWQDRAHFFAVSAQMMRRILVDAARARGAEKRGGGWGKLNLNESIDGLVDRSAELIALDDAMEALAAIDARKAKVVEMRFFGGMSVAETAAVLQISEPSVLRDWKLARAWLMREMGTRL